jgi:hypothetical protein
MKARQSQLTRTPQHIFFLDAFVPGNESQNAVERAEAKRVVVRHGNALAGGNKMMWLPSCFNST